MSFFYFDESIHERAGFILGAFVSFDIEPSEMISGCLARAGIRPGIEEFKSGARMIANPIQAAARQELQLTAFRECRVAVVVLPSGRRDDLGHEAVLALEKVISSNVLRGPHEVFLDQGMISDRRKFGEFAQHHGLDECGLHIEQNSVQVMGLQVADLAAHTCATQLLGRLGFVNKQVRWEDAGYDGMDLELTFVLWALLRGRFYSTHPVHDESSGAIDWNCDVVARGGLHVAESCSSELRDVAMAQFGTTYLGCIH